MDGAMKLRCLSLFTGLRVELHTGQQQTYFPYQEPQLEGPSTMFVDKMMAILHRVIHFPWPEEMEEVGAGFAHLAVHKAFCCAAGAMLGFFLQNHKRMLTESFSPQWYCRLSVMPGGHFWTYMLATQGLCMMHLSFEDPPCLQRHFISNGLLPFG
ncbi:hypothetical protein LDENG_00219810 [Lucifuga dentata]|nr:hypothetical protein LDENG_00219810 [Lucifuga dentata]